MQTESEMLRLSSSLRRTTTNVTLANAERIAPTLGITRVTDTTWLDKIGIPVFASIRPNAKDGSLCVNAGKGLRPEEAQVGAYMEAIEFAMAEFGRSNVSTVLTTPRQIAESLPANCKFIDFCPIFGRQIESGKPIHAVVAKDVQTNAQVLVPAELVFIPFDDHSGQMVFGQSTNGLSSGNDILEATVHGVAEIIERDVQAFNYIKDNSHLVSLDTESPLIHSLLKKIQAANLDISVKYTENEFNLPYFEAFILEQADEAPISVAQGTGLHPIKEIALVRAICEAAQSRLSHIHGGRDDIIQRVKFFEKIGRKVELDAISQVRHQALNAKRSISYSKIPDHATKINSLSDAFDLLLMGLKNRDISSILRVQFSDENAPLQVVKIIIPKMESFQAGLKRIGPRLSNYIKQNG